MSKKLLSGPYLLWMIGFTVIPLALIVFYGLTDLKRRIYSGQRPFHRNRRAPEGPVFIPGSFPDQHPCVSASGLSTGYDLTKEKYRERKLCGLYFHSSYVDELPAAYPGMADPAGEKWCH